MKATLILLLMGNQFLLNNSGQSHQARHINRLFERQHIRHLTNLLQYRLQTGMFPLQSGMLFRIKNGVVFNRHMQSTQRIENHGYIDNFLENRPINGRQVPQGGKQHGDRRQRQTNNDTLPGDQLTSARNAQTVGQGTETVFHQDRIGRLRTRTRTARTNGHPNIGNRQGRRIIDAIAKLSAPAERKLRSVIGLSKRISS